MFHRSDTTPNFQGIIFDGKKLNRTFRKLTENTDVIHQHRRNGRRNDLDVNVGTIRRCPQSGPRKTDRPDDLKTIELKHI